MSFDAPVSEYGLQANTLFIIFKIMFVIIFCFLSYFYYLFLNFISDYYICGPIVSMYASVDLCIMQCFLGPQQQTKILSKFKSLQVVGECW